MVRVVSNMINTAVETILETEPPKTPREAEGMLSRVVKENGFEYFTYVGGQVYTFSVRGLHKFVRQPTVITTLPTEWITLYHAKNFGTVDPVVSTVFGSRLPTVWDMQRRHDPVGTDAGTFLRTAHDFDVCRGYTVPIFGPEGDYGLLSYVSVEGEKEFSSLIDDRKSTLFMLAHHIHQMMRQFDDDGETDIHLTHREQEVLQWTAEGKTSSEIGIILTVSEKTVQYHLYNAMRKLDVYSRAQAVCKAILMGLIYVA